MIDPDTVLQLGTFALLAVVGFYVWYELSIRKEMNRIQRAQEFSNRTVFTIEDVLKFEFEDGGSAAIAEVGYPDQDHFVRLQSWTQTGRHEIVEKLDGKRVRVTVEIIDEEEDD